MNNNTTKILIIIVLYTITNIISTLYINKENMNLINKENIKLKSDVKKIRSDLENTTQFNLKKYIVKTREEDKNYYDEKLNTLNKSIKVLKNNSKEINSFLNEVAVETHKIKDQKTTPSIEKNIKEIFLKLSNYIKIQNDKNNDLEKIVVVLSSKIKKVSLNNSNSGEENINLLNSNKESLTSNLRLLINLQKDITKLKTKINNLNLEDKLKVSENFSNLSNRILSIETNQIELNNIIKNPKNSLTSNNKSSTIDSNDLFFTIYKIINNNKFFIKEKNGEVFADDIGINDKINNEYIVKEINTDNKSVLFLNIETKEKIRLFER